MVTKVTRGGDLQPFVWLSGCSVHMICREEKSAIIVRKAPSPMLARNQSHDPTQIDEFIQSAFRVYRESQFEQQGIDRSSHATKH
jgi:hypothetical protein